MASFQQSPLVPSLALQDHLPAESRGQKAQNISHMPPYEQKRKQLRHHLDLFTMLSISTRVFRVRMESLTLQSAVRKL